ncbi:Chaperone of endosialidase [Pseudarcicella hirudinis]|uniref:Chaperone of endosialidase n=1 Tax=Pseudarcicella hirudinis TaxID=1079859 RepID=A0A1I5NL57_9BACT|nr:tail fiber domain-containing protein [Pseudarcicella hirudinis]SFP22514.1 Chaperone of endosialidase [Pseudarcicella hirudinis]
MKKLSILCALVLMGTTAFAQQRISDGTANAAINPDAVVEMQSNNKGMLLPRVALTGTANAAPLSAHVAGMHIYNTATVGDVKPGEYYNNGTKWVSIGGTGWYLSGTTTDAGDNKTNDIYRNGEITAVQSGFTNNAAANHSFGTLGRGLIELCSTGTIYIDFKDNSADDFDGRLTYNPSAGEFDFWKYSGGSFPQAFIGAGGYKGKAGINATAFSNTFNFNWTGGALEAWIDATKVGNVSLTSDRRLKSNIAPYSFSALEKVARLKPVTFYYKDIPNSIFKADSQQKLGFIADELQQVVPSAVSGEKDAVTTDGQIQPQTLNLAPVVSLLTKAIQEQQAQIEALKKQVEALQEKK